MSVESQVRRARARLIFWRLVGDVISIPRILLSSAATFLSNIAVIFASIERTIFALEVDASRAYRALTGVDLGLAVGEPNRYSGARQGVANLRDRSLDGTLREDDDE